MDQPAETKFDWHRGPISNATVIDSEYRHTPSVRRFFIAECGPHFKFDRKFMMWIKAAIGTTMGEAAATWRQQHP